MTDFVLAFGLIAVVLTITALVSGLVQRSPLSFPLIFLGLGLLLGEGVLGIIEIGPHDPALEIVATLTLSLVLFLDAVKLQIDELGKRWVTPALILGPGTGLIIGLGAVAMALLFGFPWVVAVIGGAVLASTDPVVLREIVRDRRIPRSMRQTLKIEVGMNDIIVLPVILVLIAVATDQASDTAGWLVLLVKLLLLGPAIGFIIGGVGSWLVSKIDARMNIPREYQALYGVGLVLASYAAATTAGGDGFLSAFAAGLAVVLLNQKLCDCFLEFGEVTSEMAMLLAFILFGAALSGIFDTVAVGSSVILAVLVIFVIRPSVLGLVLARARISWEGHAFISWFGPRGLNSLLLALLVVNAGILGSELLLATIGVVVLASVLLHGATAVPAISWYGKRAARETLREEREGTVSGLLSHPDEAVPRITTQGLKQLLDEPNPPLVLDVRSRSSYERDGERIPSGIRVLPDEVTEWASANCTDRLIVTYCT